MTGWLASPPGVFIGLTVLMFGGAAYLTGQALAGAWRPPREAVRYSLRAAEQEAAHLLFRGVFGLLRNPSHHRLLGAIDRQRVIQLLGWLDYLLHLIESSVETARDSEEADGESMTP